MKRTNLVQLIALFLLVAGMGHTVQAQVSHTLTIREGQVYLDGKRLSTEALPPRLDLEGVSAQLTFTGESVPVIELGGSLFAIENGALRLVEVEEERANDGVAVFFREQPAPPGWQRRSDGVGISAAGYPRVQAYEARTRAADNQQKMELIERARLQAEEAERVVEVMPRLEVQSYLSDIQAQNQVLYQRLVREWQLEAQVQNRAMELRGFSKEEMQPHLAEMRTLLDAIFELKQENRRHEMVQLEKQLTELRQRLEKREAQREYLIERRLQELLGVDTTEW